MNHKQSSGRIADSLPPFVSNLAATDIPDNVFNVAERSFTDTIGVILAGKNEPEMEIARSLFEQDSYGLLADDDSSLPVAFVNGVAGHCLDFDDCWQGGAIHPSVTVVPAVLAAADSDTGGSELLTAYVSGVETQGYLASFLLPDHYENGWHTTATLGTLGVTAAVSNLLGLDTEDIENALNLAASLPGGLKRNFGTTTKSVHTGQAARSGITAARLAANGATADKHAIGGERGFVDLYGGNSAQDISVDRLGSDWTLLDPGIQLKKFPCCNYTHSSIEAALRLREQISAPVEEIDRVTVSVSSGAVETVTHEDPSTPLEAKFSFEYTVAAALAMGSVTLESFEPSLIQAPTVQRLRERVSAEMDPDLPYESLVAEVSISVGGDVELSEIVKGPPGAGPTPLSEAELQEKFHRCSTRVLDQEQSESLFKVLRSLREQSSLDSLAVL